jgi:CRP-like cAMP-binding protein
MAQEEARGPSIKAASLWGPAKDELTQLLTEDERAQLSVIASIVRIKKGAQIYKTGDTASAIFNIVDGVVKSYRGLADGTEHINGFLFSNDLFGLAEAGQYVNSTRAITNTTAYRIPVAALESRLRKNAALEFHVICRLCHDLRETQRHAILLGRHSALARVSMFIQMLEQHQAGSSGNTNDIPIPMSRSDIADYVGMSLEAVSRTFRALAKQQVIGLTNHRLVRILDRDRLETLATA